MDYQKGMNSGLLRRIMNKDTPPQTLNEWYEVAIMVDNQYRYSEELSRIYKGLSSDKKEFKTKKPEHAPSPSSSNPHPPPKDPNAMDID